MGFDNGELEIPILGWWEGAANLLKDFAVLFESVAVSHVMSANLHLVNVCASEDKHTGTCLACTI
jgi:hypothetical protein